MSTSFNYKNLPSTAKNSLLIGLFFALVIALPLFVWTALNVNFNLNKRAQGEPNSCGGTCGSNYNCKANLYCYKGYCRNPLCSYKTDCNCTTATISPTATPAATVTPSPTIKPIQTQTPIATVSATPSIEPVVELQINEPENVYKDQFFAEYALYLFGLFVLIVILSIYLTVKSNRKNNHSNITPPTNI